MTQTQQYLLAVAVVLLIIGGPIVGMLIYDRRTGKKPRKGVSVSSADSFSDITNLMPD